MDNVQERSSEKAPNRLSAVAAAAAIRRGELTSEDLVKACLTRIEAREEAVRAWTYLDPDDALKQARDRDARPARGPLHGVPVGIKDVFDTEGMPTSYGSPIYAQHRPAWDAACVGMIREAGAVILGKTVTTEFAARYAGKTRHPQNLTHTPGGSSSGSAAAVADAMVPLALGTQTLGSVIRPAAYCGVVGYKPTFGAINRMGLRMLSESLDTIGLFGRTVPDIRLLGSVLTGYQSTESLNWPPRIGFCRSPQWPHALPETIVALERVVQALAVAGIKVQEVRRPEILDGLAEAADVVSEFEIARAFTHERRVHVTAVSPAFTDIIATGLGHSRAAYMAAQSRLERGRREFSAVMVDHDALLTPSAPGEAPRGLGDTGSAIFNKIWTALQLPCVTIPAGSGPTGLPIGVQLIGGRNQDDVLLELADRLSTIPNRGTDNEPDDSGRGGG